MFDLKGYLATVEMDCAAEIEKRRKEIRACPEGTLLLREKNGAAYYVQAIGGVEKGITKDTELINSLARKRYLKEYNKNLEAELRTIRQFRRQCGVLSPQEIVQNLSATYQSLPLHSFFQKQTDNWANEDYPKNTQPIKVRIVTNGGVFVRSKSEQTIGNALETKGIPYRYEGLVVLGKKIKSPDFTIKRPWDGAILIWEHIGMLHEQFYVDETKEKLKLYADHDWLPGKNLICSYEEDTKDTRCIYQIIDLYIIKNHG